MFTLVFCALIFGYCVDIGSVMNPYRDVKPPPMAYADFHAGKAQGGIRPRALVVGDRYFWTMPTQQMQETAFKGIDFFYYNRDLFRVQILPNKSAEKR